MPRAYFVRTLRGASLAVFAFGAFVGASHCKRATPSPASSASAAPSTMPAPIGALDASIVAPVPPVHVASEIEAATARRLRTVAERCRRVGNPDDNACTEARIRATDFSGTHCTGADVPAALRLAWATSVKRPDTIAVYDRGLDLTWYVDEKTALDATGISRVDVGPIFYNAAGDVIDTYEGQMVSGAFHITTKDAFPPAADVARLAALERKTHAAHAEFRLVGMIGEKLVAEIEPPVVKPSHELLLSSVVDAEDLCATSETWELPEDLKSLL